MSNSWETGIFYTAGRNAENFSSTAKLHIYLSLDYCFNLNFTNLFWKHNYDHLKMAYIKLLRFAEDY